MGFVGLAMDVTHYCQYALFSKPAQAYLTKNSPAALKALQTQTGGGYAGSNAVSLRYTIESGQTLDVLRFVSPERIAVLAAGKPLDILYERGDPKTFIYKDDDLSIGWSSPLAGILCFFLFWLLVKYDKAQKVREQEIAAGTVKEAVFFGATSELWVMRLLFMTISGVMYFLAGLGGYEVYEFHLSGKTALVQPIDKYKASTTVTKHLIVVETNRSTNSADIVFETADKTVVRLNRSIPDDAIDRFKAGEPVEIKYLSYDPYRTRFASDKSMWWSFLLLAFGATWLTVLMWKPSASAVSARG